MFGRHKTAFSAFAAVALAALGLLGSPSASAECACMCVDGVAYEVCTGIVTTQAITEACTQQTQCPADTPEEEPGTGDPVEPPEGSDSAGLDCRIRNVYRPDLGRYKSYAVCMPQKLAELHQWLVEKRSEIRAELAERYAERRAERHEARADWAHSHSRSRHKRHHHRWGD